MMCSHIFLLRSGRTTDRRGAGRKRSSVRRGEAIRQRIYLIFWCISSALTFCKLQGFSTWIRRDFSIQACEKYGCIDIKSIAYEMEGKTEEEVERYVKVFKERYKELNDYDRIIKNIERGEARIFRKDEIMKAICKKLVRYKNPWLELKIQYCQNKGKLYNKECDRFMLCMVHKLGYDNWDEVKAAFRTSPSFRFDWFVKSRTTEELARRCDTLIRLVEKENQEFGECERQVRKDKKLAKNLTPTKRSMTKTPAPEIPAPTSLKKQKQSSVDDFVSSTGLVCSLVPGSEKGVIGCCFDAFWPQRSLLVALSCGLCYGCISK